jgi:lipoyl(octanoyl) transferase
MTRFPLTTWRLIRTSAATGAWNMAVDEAILDAVRRDEAPATLRLYAWEPACFSLGYAQPIGDVDKKILQEHGWHLVRRPTGGRAILHTDEITYSVVGPPEDPRLAGGVLESYKHLASALLNALHILGIPAEALEKPSSSSAESTRHHEENPICFEVPSNYEITVVGKKLIGSAQARRRDGVLQHGSLPLHGDLTRIVRVLALPGEEEKIKASERLLARATTVQAILGKTLPWEIAADALVAAFKQTLNLDLELSHLTEAEEQRARELVEEKYANPRWTERV